MLIKLLDIRTNSAPVLRKTVGSRDEMCPTTTALILDFCLNQPLGHNVTWADLLVYPVLRNALVCQRWILAKAEVKIGPAKGYRRTKTGCSIH